MFVPSISASMKNI